MLKSKWLPIVRIDRQCIINSLKIRVPMYLVSTYIYLRNYIIKIFPLSRTQFGWWEIRHLRAALKYTFHTYFSYIDLQQYSDNKLLIRISRSLKSFRKKCRRQDVKLGKKPTHAINARQNINRGRAHFDRLFTRKMPVGFPRHLDLFPLRLSPSMI